MDNKKFVIGAAVAVSTLGIGAWLFRNKKAAAEEVPQPQPEPNPSIFDGLRAAYPATIEGEFVVSVFFMHKGRGGMYDVGVYIVDAEGRRYVASHRMQLQDHADWAGFIVDIPFAPLVGSKGTADAFCFVKKAELPFGLDTPMEISTWDRQVVTII